VTVSTHVLDATAGVPAAGVPVSLSFRSARGWLTFGTGQYFAARGVATFYPEVAITFTVATEPNPAGKDSGHYHVPLLLSPFGYSTYRGN